MEQLMIPSEKEIAFMSPVRSQRERIRLLNEIAFARGDEAIGGGVHNGAIAACQRALEAIDERLRALSRCSE
jgi:hypothetical protein